LNRIVAIAARIRSTFILTQNSLTIEIGGELFGKSTVGKLGLKADDIVLVICAFRELTNDFADDNIVTKLPKNTIVLGKHDLQSIYSPTLASRPQFLSSLVKEAIGNIDYQ